MKDKERESRKIPDRWELIGQGTGRGEGEARVDAWVWRREPAVPVPGGGESFRDYAVTSNAVWDYYVFNDADPAEPAAPRRPDKTAGRGHATLDEAVSAVPYTMLDPRATRRAVEAAREDAHEREAAERRQAQEFARVRELRRLGARAPSANEDHGHSH